MNKTIHYFGDSHTAGIGEVNPNPLEPGIYYHIPFRKYLDDLLGIPNVNHSFGGKNFMLNVRDVFSNLHTFKKGDIVLFQTQFFCNSILKYGDFDFVVSSGRFDSNQIYKNDELDINEGDSITLLNWTIKFEERRSLYDLNILIDTFKYLRTQGINTYLLYWTRAYDIELPNNELVLTFDGNPYVCDGDVPTITKATNGAWKDEHTTNEFNEELANKIYKIING